MLTQFQVDEGEIGGWGYTLEPTERKDHIDTCNTEWALLALEDAQSVGVKVPRKTWLQAWEFWNGQQLPDGSWGYRHGTQGSGSMTCAGIHSALIIGNKLEKPEPQFEQSIKRAQEWLERHYAINENPNQQQKMYHLYYLYGLSRAGTTLKQRLIGEHDWYQEGVEMLTASQDKQAGSWKTRGALDGPVGSSFALLFLSSKKPINDQLND